MQRRGLLILVLFVVVVAGGSLLLDRDGGGAGEAERVAHAATISDSAPGLDPLVVPGVPESVQTFLRNGQDWRAARAMREYLRREKNRRPEAILLAARAEAGWGGWDRVRDYLQGESWLGTVHGGEGWYWLGRALEEDGARAEALAAYGSFLAAAGGRRDDLARVAELRRGLILLREGRVEEGAKLLQGLREHAPQIGSRIDVMAAEALAARGDTGAVRRLVEGSDGARLDQRGRRALLTAYEKAGDLAGARGLALGFRAAAGEGERAALSLRAARLSLRLGDPAAARSHLKAALAAPGSSAARDAAGELAELGSLSAAERLEIASVYDRHGANARAASHYRIWLNSGAGSAAERDAVRLRLARALFDAREYAEASAALRPLADATGQLGADAMYLRGRAEYRRGNRTAALTIFRQTAARFPGTESGSEALFSVADLTHDKGDTGSASTLYRRVAADFRGTDRAGHSLMRLGGLAFARGDHAAAARAWEEYRSTYPRGERWQEATYWAARAYEAAGDKARARALFQAAREREALSYYTLRASERLGVPFWPVAMDSAPPENPAARSRVAEWMHGVDLLRDAGLHDEAEQEVDRLIRTAGDDRALLYPLAEILNERGYTVRGIRLGYRLRDRDGLNPRVLRILYPFPYRAMIAAEAREKDLDPALVAALIRQESSFKARIASPVGARGLMQVMPETGRGIAAAAGIQNWDTELLYQPEINAHLGTRFLAGQMRRWKGSLPSVFAAYNAGPHRVQRWQRFPEYRDEELFAERIPFRETRDYVKILTRNIAVYEGLYGEGL